MTYSKKSSILVLSLVLVGLCVASTQLVNAAKTPPQNVPGKGQGHEMGGKKGSFFVTASGNNPYISFHTKGNTTQASVFRVKFEKLVFFTDVNGDGAYDPKNDTAKNTLVLSTLQWTTGDLVSNGDKLTITLNASAAGVFDEMAIVIHYSNNTSNDTSNSLKFDLIFRNMQASAYNGGDYIALKHQLFIDFDAKKGGKEAQFRNGTDDDESDSVKITSGDNEEEAKMDWEKEAEVDGKKNSTAVKGHMEDDSQGNTRVSSVYLTFPKFVNLTYDPIITIASSTTIDGPDYVLVGGQLFVFSAILVLNVRKKKLTKC